MDWHTNREIGLVTPLEENVLLFRTMTVKEQLAGLFRFELDMLSERKDIKFEEIAGRKITVRLNLPTYEKRYFNGFVTHFRQTGLEGKRYVYHATVHPWLWFLSRSSNCRIFQNKTVPEIVRQVFREHGFSDYEVRLRGSYRIWEYCVQYREIDLNFVNRLLEHEGIYYYFKHENGKHTLVLSDSVSSHGPFPGYEEVSYIQSAADDDQAKLGWIFDWNMVQKVQPGAVERYAYNYRKSNAPLNARFSAKNSYPMGNKELFEGPQCAFPERGDGEDYTRKDKQRIVAHGTRARGNASARGIAAGSLFKLANHWRDNAQYLVVSAVHHLRNNAYESGHAWGKGDVYSCSFTACPSNQPFRPLQSTPKPVIHGIETAVVTGPPGEEIYTDELGRVKVQFHWDRYGKNDHNSSCWIRVSQPWAGDSYGGMCIPRVGQEVTVAFVQGDPDHPMIIGRVYNSDQGTPFNPAEEAHATVIRTHSTPNGNPNDYNELYFGDEYGNELVRIRAQYNMATTVLNNKSVVVRNDFDRVVKEGNFTATVEMGSYVLDAKQQIVLKCGSSKVTIGPESVVIESPDIQLNPGVKG